MWQNHKQLANEEITQKEIYVSLVPHMGKTVYKILILEWNTILHFFFEKMSFFPLMILGYNFIINPIYLWKMLEISNNFGSFPYVVKLARPSR